ncbi:hypothetical protein CNMCM8980_002711 [Aspergillus fumigatiaffinis]|uniref:Serine protease n=1 Tax=Aspergillus fumigatiaffinis TaxID=340414 RepID=A0A8H4GSM5_9EURO|nr:hypothetical protein CNMCM6805_003106 [Aspergillus fumigatiaffinis]KAF4236892.1 hypothetical protein CNMCM8980_002711 [Aspergillus fumigatiaffinis]
MSQESLFGGDEGGRGFTLQIKALVGQTASRLDTPVEINNVPSKNCTDSFVPEGLGVTDIEKAKTEHFKAQKADELKQLFPDGRADRLVERDQVIDYKTYPFSCIGKLFVGANANFTAPLWTGSAAMVGRNLLLTASHCAPWNSSGTGAMPGWWMRFVPSYHSGSEPYGSSYVQDFRGLRNTDNVTGLDYVICRLYNPIGATCGWLGSQWWSDNAGYSSTPWTSVGYPGDAMNGQVMMIEKQIRLHQVDAEGAVGRELEAHTFSTPGWSGGPMFGVLDAQQRCVGVMSGKEFEDDGLTGSFSGKHWHSVSAGGKGMTDLILYGLANWA